MAANVYHGISQQAAAREDRSEVEVEHIDIRPEAELDFVEKGGYGRSVRTPWLPTSAFQDSLTCLSFGDPERMRRAFIRAFGQPPQSLRRAARAL